MYRYRISLTTADDDVGSGLLLLYNYSVPLLATFGDDSVEKIRAQVVSPFVDDSACKLMVLQNVDINKGGRDYVKHLQLSLHTLIVPQNGQRLILRRGLGICNGTADDYSSWEYIVGRVRSLVF